MHSVRNHNSILHEGFYRQLCTFYVYHNEQHLLFPHTCILQHNLCCDNCHSHVARALNLMRYNGSTSWNMYKLGFLVLLYGKYTGSANVQNVHVHIHVYYACIFTCTYVHIVQACEFCVCEVFSQLRLTPHSQAPCLC